MQRHSFDLKHTKNYATEDSAEKALQKLPEYIKGLHGVRYFIAHQAGRFVPVVQLATPDVQYLAGTTARLGFYTIL